MRKSNSLNLPLDGPDLVSSSSNHCTGEELDPFVISESFFTLMLQ